MTEQAQNTLRGRLERARTWPIPSEKKGQELIHLWVSFRENDDIALRRVAQWQEDRQYFIDPLPAKIPEAWGSMIWGEDPTFSAATAGDQEQLDGLVAENRLATSLQDAEGTVSSEGEGWWRISINPDASSRAILSWHSRADVVPIFHGPQIVAAAFVTRLDQPNGDTSDDAEVYRHLEVHSRGRVENWLYKGNKGELGQRIALGAHPDTANLRDVWQHNIPATLAGRIPNKIGRRPQFGISDYHGVWGLFLVLNEGLTIGR